MDNAGDRTRYSTRYGIGNQIIAEISVEAIIRSKYRVCWGLHQTPNDPNYRIEMLHVKLDRQCTDRTVDNNSILTITRDCFAYY